MKTQFNDVGEFHTKFGLPNVHNQLGLPPRSRSLSDEEALFRLNFMTEELAEYAEASGFDTIAKVLKSICEGIKDKDHFLIYRSEKRDLHGQFDALIDLNYVLLGTAQMQALPFDRGFDVVHEKNMQKVRATSEEQSKRGTRLDVVKPEGWTPPDLSRLLK